MKVLNGEIWRLRVACFNPSQASINVVHFKVTQQLNAGCEDTEAATGFDVLLAPLYKALLSDDATYRGVSIQRISPLPVSRPATGTASEGIGQVVGEILPTQVAGIISAKTQFAGRKQRGRIYLPFPSEASSEVPGLPTAGYLASGQALANAIYAEQTFGVGVNTSTFTPVVWHRSNNSSDPITGAQVRKLWATQRRRGSYGRHNLPPF